MKRKVVIRLSILGLLLLCLLFFRTNRTVNSEALIPLTTTPVSYQVQFEVVLVGEVLSEENVFYMNLKVLEDPRKYLSKGEVMQFEMPAEDYKAYKPLQNSIVYLWCEEFFYVDIQCDIYNYIKEE